MTLPRAVRVGMNGTFMVFYQDRRKLFKLETATQALDSPVST